MDRELPLIGDADAEFYMRQEGRGLLLGVYESPCTHWAVDGTPQDFGHELLPDDLARMEHNMAQAIESVPVLARAGIRRVVNGPMIFSPDLNPLVGPLPGLRNYWCACGVMTAFSQAGAVGKVLAEWMTNGDPGLDFLLWDVTRYGDWAGRAYTMARTADMYSTRFQTHYPYEERAAGRPARTTPVYPLLKEAGAVFGASWGYEYPLWYAPEGTKAEDELTFRRPNWFGPVGEEAPAVRAALGLFETSIYGKFSVRGPGAGEWLDRMMANRMPVNDGRIVLTPMLNEAGREPEERLVLFEIDAGDPDPPADPWGGESVLRDGEYVGYLTSAGYGHCAGRTLAFGYVRSDAIASNAAYDVEVIGKPRPARRLERPPIDPEGLRMRA